MPRHRECRNFSWRLGGYCTLKDRPVDPEGPACPLFVPRGVAGALGMESGDEIDWFHLAIGLGFVAIGALIIWRFVLKK